MKIKDLIKELSEYNPESEVLFSNSIECFRSNSGCSFLSDVSIDTMTKEDLKEEMEGFDIEDNVKEEILDSVKTKEFVHILVSGEETWND
jgi:hypothetical protein